MYHDVPPGTSFPPYPPPPSSTGGHYRISCLRTVLNLQMVSRPMSCPCSPCKRTGTKLILNGFRGHKNPRKPMYHPQDPPGYLDPQSSLPRNSGYVYIAAPAAPASVPAQNWFKMTQGDRTSLEIQRTLPRTPQNMLTSSVEFRLCVQGRHCCPCKHTC